MGSNKTIFSLPRIPLIGLLFLAGGISLMAGPIFQNSATVFSPTNVATFDSITDTGIDLSTYTEDGLSISINDVSYTAAYYAQTYYGHSGNSHWVTISLVGGGAIYALDFTLGDGWGLTGTTNLIWETFSGGFSTGIGDVVLPKETTVGWADLTGFDSIRVAAHYTNIDSFGAYQGIKIDNLRVDSSHTVPDASSTAWLALLSLGFMWVVGKIRRDS